MYNHTQTCRYSEKSRTKCIGITIETRPDYCLKRHLGQMLSYGCTRLEIGVQVSGERWAARKVESGCDIFSMVLIVDVLYRTS